MYDFALLVDSAALDYFIGSTLVYNRCVVATEAMQSVLYVNLTVFVSLTAEISGNCMCKVSISKVSSI